MQLHERLKNLVGHEIFVHTRTEDDERGVPGGTLQEVGTDYLIVKTEDEEKGGFATTGAQWFVILPWIISIIHAADCKKCAIETADRSPS